jgi:hypothetical protein
VEAVRAGLTDTRSAPISQPPQRLTTIFARGFSVPSTGPILHPSARATVSTATMRADCTGFGFVAQDRGSGYLPGNPRMGQLSANRAGPSSLGLYTNKTRGPSLGPSVSPSARWLRNRAGGRFRSPLKQFCVPPCRMVRKPRSTGDCRNSLPTALTFRKPRARNAFRALAQPTPKAYFPAP